jgi:hypothetical protein
MRILINPNSSSPTILAIYSSCPLWGLVTPHAARFNCPWNEREPGGLLRDFQAEAPLMPVRGFCFLGTKANLAHLEFECQATFTTEKPCPFPGRVFH